MIVYPAIDLRGGRCVRLTEGDFARETVYGEDPVAMARRWEAAGARWLHVVDLDGARAGGPVQSEIVGRICRAVTIPVQVGGGLRDAAAVRTVFDAGAARAILGTVAVRDPGLCAEICRTFAGRIAVGIDARDGFVRVAGWEEGSAVRATELAREVAARGAAAIVYTDIARDGTERGPNLEDTRTVARAAAIPVIASGGVGALAHVAAAAALAADGVAGVIVGRALYTGAVRLEDALRVAGAA
ncbi:MAG TPA: 1-(5-phosphoribosyl)-5-[(5-phosphoribosylamino)methylideneamino]imidazole-4-carboxamide isomerase [Candidatus Eisenbacteria bacterium]|nr:1-(5-phosphoribosyl)-5-[(5-phosphoribosylamino)methylideneamino]imidazole-4-carboxamide isomerase [Candidatus Eisenbacteria bacterium]